MIYDYIIIGGGIVGLSVALKLSERRPGCSILLLEKEHTLASHQTGRNSGVIHAGIYYAPGSLKAKLCGAGAAATKAFCREHGIPYEERGKILVATSPIEETRMAELAGRATQNGIPVEPLTSADISGLEPSITGRAGLLVPSSAIVDYTEICASIAAVLRARGAAEIRLGAKATSIAEEVSAISVRAGAEEAKGRYLVACAGLQSDRIARLAGVSVDQRIAPFRGEYFSLSGIDAPSIRHLIYPIPDPSMPFLGVHLTPMIGGATTVGPNAVLSFSRENYRRGAVTAADLVEMLSYTGLRRAMLANWRSGVSEFWSSCVKSAYLRRCQQYCPSLRLDHLAPHPTGIRAQAISATGELLHDFVFAESSRSLHVCNAPSPAATAALPIADIVVAKTLRMATL